MNGYDIFNGYDLYEIFGYETDLQYAEYVARVDLFPSCASTLTDDGYQWLVMWEDVEELFLWACDAHDVDPWDAVFMVDGAVVFCL